MSAELKFVDTNVLVYLFDGDSPDEQARARELLGMEVENIVLSTQVLGEFYVTVTRKLANPIGLDAARKAVDDLCAFPVRPLQAELVRTAVSRSGASKLSYWDALIVETAIDAGAAVLLTAPAPASDRLPVHDTRPHGRFLPPAVGMVLPFQSPDPDGDFVDE